MQLHEAARAEPDENHIAQHVLLALGNALAAPAELQGFHGPFDVRPHFHYFITFFYLLHRIPLSALTQNHLQHVQNRARERVEQSPGSHDFCGTNVLGAQAAGKDAWRNLFAPAGGGR